MDEVGLTATRDTIGMPLLIPPSAPPALFVKDAALLSLADKSGVIIIFEPRQRRKTGAEFTPLTAEPNIGPMLQTVKHGVTDAGGKPQVIPTIPPTGSELIAPFHRRRHLLTLHVVDNGKATITHRQQAGISVWPGLPAHRELRLCYKHEPRYERFGAVISVRPQPSARSAVQSNVLKVTAATRSLASP